MKFRKTRITTAVGNEIETTKSNFVLEMLIGRVGRVAGRRGKKGRNINCNDEHIDEFIHVYLNIIYIF